MFIYTVILFMGMAYIAFEFARNLPTETFNKISKEISELEGIALNNPVTAISVMFVVLSIALVAVGYVLKFELSQLLLFMVALCVTLFVFRSLLDKVTYLSREYVDFLAVLLVTFLGVSYALNPTWLVSNVLTVAMAAFAIRLLSSVPLKLLGLVFVSTFIYDIVHVYITGYMIETATQVMNSEVPGPLFRAPASLSNLGLAGNSGSVLGAGDVIIPGILVMKGIQLGIKSQMILAYMIGLVAAFVILITTGMPVPALITLLPITFVTLITLAKKRKLAIA